MSQSELLIRILLTIVFGAILGLETQTRDIEDKGEEKANEEEKSKLGGLRTYTILSLYGGVAGIFYIQNFKEIVLLSFTGIILLILAAYFLNVQVKKAFGLTTEIAILITFLLGFLTTSKIVQLEVVLVILVLLTFFLSQKRGFGGLIHKIQHRELIDIIKFGLVAIVILPLIPDKTYYVSDVVNIANIQNSVTLKNEIATFSLINPFKMWFIVVVISGLDLLGYLLSKFVGSKRGIWIASFLGGLVSSTSTTVALANKAKLDTSRKSSILLAGCAIASNAASFVDTSVILLMTSTVLFQELFPAFIAMFLIGIIISVYMVFYKGKNDASKQSLTLKYEPFSIIPALKFVGLIILIKFFVQLLQLSNLGDISVVITSISGVIGFDPVVLAMGDLYQSNNISLDLAVATLLLANIINFVAKMVYGYILGSRNFAKYISIGLVITAIGSFAVFLI